MNIVAKGRCLPTVREMISIITTFGLTAMAWIFFRANSIGHAFSYISGIFSKSLFTVPSYPDRTNSVIVLLLIAVFMFIEWFGREGDYAIEKMADKWKRPVRYAFYYSILFAILYFGGEEQQFIYFQF